MKNLTKIEIEKKKDFLFYEYQVRTLTEETVKKYYIEDIKLRGKKYHVDHMVSVKSCFDFDLLPEWAAHPCNLKVITATANLSKSNKNSLSREELVEEILIFEKDQLDYDEFN